MGGWATQIILVNPTEKPLKGTLQFFDPNGGVTNVTIGGVPTVTEQGESNAPEFPAWSVPVAVT